MHPQYNLKVYDHQIQAFRASLEQLYINNKPVVFREKEGGFFSIDLGHKNMTNEQVLFQGESYHLTALGLANEAIDDETGSTAYHIKEGSLFIYDIKNQGEGKSGRRNGVSTCDITPSLLENFQVKIPEYMRTERVMASVE